MNINKLDRNQQKNLFFNIIIFLMVFFIAIRIPLDSDFWWHIRSGQLTVNNQQIILEDQTSFSTFGTSWINHSWLAQIIYFMVYQYSGHLGIMLLVAIIATSSMLFVFLRLKGSPILNGFVLLLGVLTTAVIWSPRPQLLSLFLFSVVSFLIFDQGIPNSKRIFGLIISIFLLWGNLHAGFSAGILLLILYFIGLALDLIFQDEFSHHINKKELITWGAVIAISSLIVLINPNGLGVWKVQFDTISIPTLQNLIPEWASPNFHELYQQPFLWLWILLVFTFMVNRSKFSYTEILPLLVFGAMGFISRRNYVYFAVLAIPILSRELNIFFDEIKKQKIFGLISDINMQKFNKNPKIWVSKLINLSLVSILLFFIAGKIIYLGSPIVFHHYEEQHYPKNALQVIRSDDLTDERCLNSYAWGGYISWNLPEMKIFIDGRTDLYGEEIIQDWLSMINAADNWQEEFENYNITCVLLEKNYQIIDQLINRSWNVHYEDDLSILLTKQ